MKIYGIKNCNTVQKAISFLIANGAEPDLQDYKKLGVSVDKLEEWSQKLGWENLINKRGTTWKKLDPEIQRSITTKEKAFALMRDNTSLIKRPVLEMGTDTLLGFDEKDYLAAILKNVTK